MHIDARHVGLNDLLGWWKNHEEEFRYLSRTARHVLCALATSAGSERNFSVPKLLVQDVKPKRRTPDQRLEGIRLGGIDSTMYFEK
jgi:hypothetical protein